MSDVVIRLVELADGSPSPYAGAWVVDFEPRLPGSQGNILLTTDRSKAKRFADFAEAHAFWTQSNGVRSDSKPNRPLTAWTVEIERVVRLEGLE